MCVYVWCGCVKNVSKIFPPSTGGAQQMASEMEVRFLGEIELDPRLGQCCDMGKSFVQHFPESRVSKSYKKICAGERVLVV